jgi:hypothetical protein
MTCRDPLETRLFCIYLYVIKVDNGILALPTPIQISRVYSKAFVHACILLPHFLQAFSYSLLTKIMGSS